MTEQAGDSHTARRQYEDILEFFQHYGDRRYEAGAMADLASVDLRDNPKAAQTWAHRLLALCAAHGLVYYTVVGHWTLGAAAFAEENYDAARQEFDNSVAVADRHNLHGERLFGSLYKAKLELVFGTISKATMCLRKYATEQNEAARRFWDIAHFVEVVTWLAIRIATTVTEQAAAYDAAILLAYAATWRAERQQVLYPFLHRINDRMVGVCQQQLGEGTFQVAWMYGQGLVLDEAIQRALERLERIDIERIDGRRVVD